jgi:hypothetical protein
VFETSASTNSAIRLSRHEITTVIQRNKEEIVIKSTINSFNTVKKIILKILLKILKIFLSELNKFHKFTSTGHITNYTDTLTG